MVTEPVTITYQNPMQCVLFNRNRDANPFFHMYESLWMLAGRNDVEPLAYYNSKMREFSDDDETFNGAYGYRWRSTWETFWEPTPLDKQVDQLTLIINHLKEKPNSRRAVLQMWNVEDDLLKVDDSKDVCCNTCVYFSIRDKVLDMTVCNRSNDMIWGTLGANAVHFAFLQEYVACALGLDVGVYNQFTNNLHVYLDKWNPEVWLDGTDPKTRDMHHTKLVEYKDYWKSFRLFDYPADSTNIFDNILGQFVESNKNGEHTSGEATWGYVFLDKVAQPMMTAFHMHKQRDYNAAFEWLDKVKAEDWKIAGIEWTRQREINWEAKQAQL